MKITRSHSRTGSLICSLVVLLCAAGPLSAQVPSASATPEEKEAPPPDPQIAPLPARIQWTVTFPAGTGPGASPKPEASASATPGSPASGQGRRVVSITTVKDGPIRVTRTTWSNGLQTVIWFTNYIFAIQDDTLGRDSLKVFDVDPEFPLIPIPSDLSELKWISRANFVKTVSYQGGKAYYYRSTEAPQQLRNRGDGAEEKRVEGEEAAKQRELQAWVSVDTRLPIALSEEGKNSRYTFSAFDGSLTLPGNIAQEIDKLRKRGAHDAALRSRVP